MPVEFDIEFIMSPKKDTPYVIARHLTPGRPFEVPENSFLDDIEIRARLSSPSAADEDGKPRFDLYVFYPRFKKDIGYFAKGMIVKLTNRPPLPPDKSGD